MSRRQRQRQHNNNNHHNTNNNEIVETPKTLLFCDPTTKQQLPPPFFMNDNPFMNNSSKPNVFFSLPKLPYASRRDLPKSAIHWGQRKLFLSELQLLTQIVPLEKDEKARPTSYWIVYVGSAPGQHLMFLDTLFGEGTHEWELIDPGKFDDTLQQISLNNNNKLTDSSENAAATKTKSRFTLRNEFFDNETAYNLMKRRLEKAQNPALARIYENFIDEFYYQQQQQQQEEEQSHRSVKSLQTSGNHVNEARTEEIPIRNVAAAKLPLGLGLLWRASAKSIKTLFVSDVRSGHEDSSSFEEHVFENSMAQETWTDILQPTFAMLKFRLPYTFVREQCKEDGSWKQVPCKYGEQTLHLDGRIMLPLFARLTSTEARLIVSEGAGRKFYNHKDYEDHFFFFNSIFRETCHFKLPSDIIIIAVVAVDSSIKISSDEMIEEESEIDHRFDAAAESWVLDEYLRKIAPKISSRRFQSVAQLSNEISRQLHGTVTGAAKLNDNRLLELADKTNNPGQQARARHAVRRAQEFRQMAVWKENASQCVTRNLKPSSVWEEMLFEEVSESEE